MEEKNSYEQVVQYDSVKSGIQAHAETYSFNIESELFNQLTKEQQALWRKEIEQACISGGDAGVTLARDQRYKENLEVKEVDLDSDIRTYLTNHFNIYEDGVLQSKKSGLPLSTYDIIKVAEHFYSLGLAQKGEDIWKLKLKIK